MIRDVEEPHKHLHESAKKIKDVFVRADVHLPALLIAKKNDHLLWADKIREALLSGSQNLDVETDPTRCALGKWLSTAKAKSAYERGDKEFKQSWDSMLASHEKLHRSAVNVQQALSNSRDDALQVFQSEVAPLLHTTLSQLDTLHAEAEHGIEGMLKANEIFAAETQPALEQVQAILGKIRNEAKKSVMTDELMLEAAQHTQRNVIIAASVAVGVGLFLAFFVSHNVVSILKKIIDGLGATAEQVASASEQVSASSQSLAEGASEQAASIEETTSSLEEMSSMTQQNADNAMQANTLMGEAKHVVAKANESMEQLTGSMGEISKASEETSKIVKTIDEIAFQTNLLALNAAVEAARAGEAGAGFAVVADEVRNLAMRAAEAAKNTSNLIEGTVKKVKDGSELVGRTNQAFREVAGTSAKAADLVSEISAASKEQAQGIGQINTAVTEMDKVTQQNAANAEESASASEELSAQAEQMQGMVAELVAMVGGSATARSPRGDHALKGAKKPRKAISMAVNKLKSKTGPAKKAARPAAEAVIPLDDKDFSDF
jgi:methyl-accepting chemotaxis protein